ncbi:uncharacterized protein LOC124278507 [Haliotis rubra]|uniref:uncharacterized protein LOC124278507 n=1 Tax=Haliotis rubra TaxID=36100 RepID=UPI001EE58B14|nr:uncharacterized protein LOC124278507 [Haliotis rubra]
MVNTELVQFAPRIVSRLSSIAAQVQAPPDTRPSTTESTPTTSTRQVETGGLPLVREVLQGQGIQGSAADIILHSWKGTTKKQYRTYLRRWMQFCCERGINSISPSLNDGLSFLELLYQKGLSYSAINSARSALSSVVKVDNVQFGQHHLVIRFMKGIFNLRPSFPRYNVTWNVSVVLQYLKAQSDSDLKELTTKLAMLLLLLSGRLQSLHLIDCRNVDIVDNSIRIRFGDLLKQTRPGHHQEEITIPGFSDNRLCVVKLLKDYVHVTKDLRGDETALFIAVQKPHKRVSKDTISRWIRGVLAATGINLAMFKPHSVRSASTSAAAAANVPLATILRTTGWSNQCVFRQFYDKPISDNGQFGETLLLMAQNDNP